MRGGTSKASFSTRALNNASTHKMLVESGRLSLFLRLNPYRRPPRLGIRLGARRKGTGMARLALKGWAELEFSSRESRAIKVYPEDDCNAG
eukprot:CAMPEP_0170495322 /NCGR_PEP_ID=MMETSP0208-20121228/15144_1 /TAXON_ID=197538 /ORGANISM="Strombidium inclinatum, Strain S3" /LENGTH=90 /DNA_ID=CAMNT_0010771495 /DNA_START=485 /DNA_END=757 /DNA_ORIENTATION=+